MGVTRFIEGEVMKHFKLISILTIGLAFFSSQAFSATLLEPSLGFSVSSKGENETGVGTSESKSNPVVLGTRFGFYHMGLMGGLDVKQHMKSDYEFSGVSTGEATMAKRDIGLFIGYNFPVFMRAWFSYHFDSRMKFDDATGQDIEYYKGSGYALGVGYTAFPLISLNLEYVRSDFDTFEQADGTEGNISDYKHTDIILSVSLPFRF